MTPNPDYTADKTASPTTVNLGDSITYSVTLTDQPGGGNPAQTVDRIVDTLPAGFTWNGTLPTSDSLLCVVTPGGTSQSGTTLTINLTGGLRNNKSCTISFTVIAGSPGSGIVNPATRFDYTRSGVSGSNTSTNLAPVTVVPYTVNKTPSLATVNGQSDLTYTVAIQNLSSTTNLDLTQVVDSLPDGFIYVKGSALIGAIPIADPVLGGTNSNQTLTWDLTGTAVAPSTTANLTYRVAIASTSTGNKTNTVTVDASMSGTSYSVSGSATVNVSTQPEQLWGTTLAVHLEGGQTLPTLNNTARGQDLAFNDSYADSNTDNWAEDGATTNDSFVWSAVQNSAKASITKAVAMLRFSVNSTYVDDKFEWQICVQAACPQTENGATHANWKKVRSFGTGQDEMPPKGAPAGSLRTIAVDVGPTGLNIVTTPAQANNVQFRIIGMGATGAGESIIIYLDEVLLVTQ